MSEDATEKMRETVDAVYCSESRRVFATLIRLLGDFDLAEEALHDAFAAAVERASYKRALTLARQEPERRFLERRLAEVG